MRVPEGTIEGGCKLGTVTHDSNLWRGGCRGRRCEGGCRGRYGEEGVEGGVERKV